MASVQACEDALRALARALDELEPQFRERYIPQRTAAVTVRDLGVAYLAEVGPAGVGEIVQVAAAEARKAQVRFSAHSDVVVEIGTRPTAFPAAWLRGRVLVSAGWRDLLELRQLL